MLQALYFCKPFREKIIQYKLAYNQRIALLNMVESGGSGSGAISSMSDLVNSNATNGLSSSATIGSSTSSAHNTTNGAINGSNTAASSSLSTTSSGNQVSILKQEHLLNCLAELFYSIVTMKKKKGVMQPKKFIARLRKDNGESKSLFIYEILKIIPFRVI